MSTGPDRGKKRSGMVARSRTGKGKPRGEGLTTIPKAVWPVLSFELKKAGWLGIIPACCVCHLSGAEIVDSWVEDDEVVVFSGRRTRRFPLQENDIKLVAQLLENIAEATSKDGMTERRRKNYVAEFLNKKIQPAVRRRLSDEGHAWSKHVNINVTTLHRVGAEQLVAGWCDKREYVRAYLRSPRAHPEDALPDSTEEIMNAYSSAAQPFWEKVDALLSPEVRAAIARLAKSH